MVFRPPTHRPRESINSFTHLIDVAEIGVRIPVLYLEPQRQSARQTTMLFAHGNGEDLVHIEPFAHYVVETLGVAIAAFEYPGYGSSMWIDKNVTDPLLPSESRCYAAAESALEWLMGEHKIPSTDIILYGRSLGSGPMVHLAALCAMRNVHCGGLILQSPIASVVRVVMPRVCLTVPLVDMFANIDKIHAVTCRTTVIHGTHDRVVPLQCGQQLDAAIPDCARSAPLYIEGAGHNDVEQHRGAWCAHMNAFVNLVVATADLAV